MKCSVSSCAIVLSLLSLAACGPLPGWRGDTTLAPVQAVPTTSVQAIDLPPPVTNGTVSSGDLGALPGLPAMDTQPGLAQPGMVQPGLVQPGIPGAPSQVASVDPSAATGAAIGRNDVVGVWSLSSTGESCKLSLSLTAWNGGNRATPLKCQSDDLKSISAWTIIGNQVELRNDAGAAVARLNLAGPKRLTGATVASRRGIQMFQ